MWNSNRLNTFSNITGLFGKLYRGIHLLDISYPFNDVFESAKLQNVSALSV